MAHSIISEAPRHGPNLASLAGAVVLAQELAAPATHNNTRPGNRGEGGIRDLKFLACGRRLWPVALRWH